MDHAIIDYLIVIAFVLITLYIGLRAGRGIKDIREYAIANKTYGTGALVLAYLATDIGGGVILDDTGCVFSDGIIVTAAVSCFVFMFIVRAFLIAPKMVYFDGCLTMGDVMEALYGIPSKVIAGILGTIHAIILSGMQLIVLGTICEYLLDIKPLWSVVTGGLIMAAYSAYGGIKAVTSTDIFQFIILVIIIPIITGTAIEHAGGIVEMFSLVPAEKLTVLGHEKFSYYLVIFVMWNIFQAGLIDPAIIQRMLMGKTGRQLRNQYLIIAAFDPALRLALTFVGLAGIVLYSTLAPQNVVIHMVQELLPMGVKGLAIAGLFGALMSTGDSYLHAAGLTFTRDVVKPLCAVRGITLNELLWARASTFLVGLGSIAVGLQGIKILDLALIAGGLIGPLLMFPLISGIVGLRPDQKSFYTGAIFALIAFGLCKLFLPASQNHLSILICTLANGVGFFGAHVLQHGGLAIVHRTPEATQEILWTPQKESFNFSPDCT